MNKTEIMNKLQNVFEDTFQGHVTVTPELSADDVDEWDSLKHVVLIIAMEKAFNIRFKVGEVENTKNIGELVDLLAARLN